MHSERNAGATLDNARDVLPKIIATKSDERIARGVRPIGLLHNLFHYCRMRGFEQFHFLIVFVKAIWLLSDR